MLLTGQGCYSDIMRDKLVDEAIKHDPDYILWIDADQTYPGDTLEVLARHIDDGKLIVGGITPTRPEGLPNVYNLIHPDGITQRKEIKLNNGLIKVDAMGLGGIMMSPKVFKILESPYFQTTWNWKIASKAGMDFKFYSRCKKANIDVWCDTDLIYDHIVVKPIGFKENNG